MEVRYITQNEYDSIMTKKSNYMEYLKRFFGSILDNNLKNKLQKELVRNGLDKYFYLEYESDKICVSILCKLEVKDDPQYTNIASEDFMKQFSDMFGGFNK